MRCVCKASGLPLGHSPHSQGCSRLSLSELSVTVHSAQLASSGTCFQFRNVVLSCGYVSFIPLIPELGPLVLDPGLTEYLENLQHPGHLGRWGQVDHMWACRELARTLCGTPVEEGFSAVWNLLAFS